MEQENKNQKNIKSAKENKVATNLAATIIKYFKTLFESEKKVSCIDFTKILPPEITAEIIKFCLDDKYPKIEKRTGCLQC